MPSSISASRLVAAGLVMLLAGIQIGLWLADYYDDGVHSPLSLAIGIAMCVAGAGLAAGPFRRR